MVLLLPGFVAAAAYVLTPLDAANPRADFRSASLSGVLAHDEHDSNAYSGSPS
jgi:hypothetical protein